MTASRLARVAFVVVQYWLIPGLLGWTKNLLLLQRLLRFLLVLMVGGLGRMRSGAGGRTCLSWRGLRNAGSSLVTGRHRTRLIYLLEGQSRHQLAACRKPKVNLLRRRSLRQRSHRRLWTNCWRWIGRVKCCCRRCRLRRAIRRMSPWMTWGDTTDFFNY